MDIYVLDKDFNTIDLVEDYEDFVWTDRFFEHGDFEMTLKIHVESTQHLLIGRYIQIYGNKTLMRITERESKEDIDGGTVVVRGLALTSMLEQRSIRGKFVVPTNVTAVSHIFTTLSDNILDVPASADRGIPGLKYIQPGSTVNKTYNMNVEFSNINVYDYITTMTKSENIGVRLAYLGPNDFNLELYGGIDRSYDQNSNPHIVFSPEFDNINNIKHYTSSLDFVNVLYFAYQKNDNQLYISSAQYRNGTQTYGLDRYETIDDLDYTGPETGTDPGPTNSMLSSASKVSFKEMDMDSLYDGEVIPSTQYIYNKDYFLGDIVQMETSENISTPARVVEYIITDGPEGPKEYPTLAEF